MKFIPAPNPHYGELRAVLAAHPEWLAPWSGHFFRVQTLLFPSAKDILYGAGAKQRGGRWNSPGLAALYGSTTDTAALEEAKANDRYYGIATKTPRLLVAIRNGKMESGRQDSKNHWGRCFLARLFEY